MKCRIAARKSHLARLQAFTVGERLKEAAPGIDIEFQFRESLGDINLHDPLWKMPEKGVFTQDFRADLLAGNCDLVVHSWKDLPLSDEPGTRILATLPREDARDILLVKRGAWEKSRAAGQTEFEILTSSPRRTYNLGPFLREALPQPVTEIHFTPVRGNIPTRLKKLMTGEAHGLVLAKAALDRLLSSPLEEFRELQLELRATLAACLVMVLPLSANPTAAAQGALAIEVADDARPEIVSLIGSINDEVTFASVTLERAILGSYGGGCHQKIGVSVFVRPYGTVRSLRGLTDAGKVLCGRALEPALRSVASAHEIFPLNPRDASFFSREALAVDKPSARYFWVARESAWPAQWVASLDDVVWTAGLETWKKLAARGIWVTGTADGLGESEPPRLEMILGLERVHWTKLSHSDGVKSDPFSFLPTYRLVPKAETPSFHGKKYFFWMSGSAFRRALELEPAIRSAWHFSGPGHTHEALKAELGAEGKVGIALSHETWLKNLLAKAPETV